MKFDGSESVFIAFTGVKTSRKQDDPSFTFKIDLITTTKPTVEAEDYSVATFEEAADVDGTSEEAE